MAWRTSTCGAGVGCDTGLPTPLCIVQGQPLDVSIPVGFDISDLSVRAEIRSAPGGRLLLNMAPYCLADPSDPTNLLVSVPGGVTAGIALSGIYDIWVETTRVLYGSALVELSVSALPPLRLLVAGWTPVLTVGEAFVREIDVDGLLPDDVTVTADPIWAPVLVVTSMDGAVVASFIGDPFLAVAGGTGTVTIDLPIEDVDAIGVGRFIYSLRVYDTLHQPWTLLAGMMIVEEVQA